MLRFVFLLMIANVSNADVLQKCIEREVSDAARAPKNISLGEPVFVSAHVPSGWSIDRTSLTNLDKGHHLSEVAFRIVDTSECGDKGVLEVTIEQAWYCKSESSVKECAAKRIKVGRNEKELFRKDLSIDGVSSLEMALQGEITFHFVGGGASLDRIINHLYLIPSSSGIIECSLTTGLDEYSEYKNTIKDVCTSLKVR
jgi:hypothetical protein